MGTKHTQGPWVVASNKTSVLALTPVDMEKQQPCPVVVDCASGFDAMSFEEAQANARLIAASPDLLACLEAILDGGIADPETVINAHRAIAKAKGE